MLGKFAFYCCKTGGGARAISIVLWIIFGAVSTKAASATIYTYPLPSIYTNSAAYTLTVNGTNIPVVSYTAQYDYAEFSMSAGTATIQVTAPTQSGITSYRISPEKLGLTNATTIAGNTLTFTISNSQYLIISINGMKPFVLGADPAEPSVPAASGTGIFNVTNSPYNADNTGSTLTSAAIQNAINAASAYGTTNGQGIVCVPAGVYLCGNLTLEGNMALYLQGGSVIRCTGNPINYVTEGGYRGSYANVVPKGTVFITASGTNIEMYGRGIVDGNGFYMGMTNNFGDNLLIPINCTNFTVDGITFRDAGGWGVVPTQSANVLLSNLKIFNNTTTYQDDCLDVVDSQNVLVTNVVGFAGDDTLSTKSYNYPITNVLFENCLLQSQSIACKIGWGVDQLQNGITFSNIVVYDCFNGVGLAENLGGASGGSTAGNITWDTIDVENNTLGSFGYQSWADFTIATNGLATNLLVRNITVRASGLRGSLGGQQPNTLINGITFDHVYMPGSTNPASNLYQMDIYNLGAYTNLVILPTNTAIQGIYLTANDPYGTTSFNAAGNWSNGQPPNSTTNYIDGGYNLRTPGSSSNVTFAGGSLSLYYNAALALKNDNYTTTVGTNPTNGLFLANSQVSNLDPGVNDTLAGYVTLLFGPGTFHMAGGVGYTFSITAAIGGPGAFQAGNSGDAGTIQLSGVNTYTGGTIFGTPFNNNVILQLAGSGTLGSTNGPLTFNSVNDILDLNGTSQGIGSLSGPDGIITNSAAVASILTIGNGGNGGGVFLGTISGPMALTMVGSNTIITLSGNNSYTGGTTISGGTLAIGGAGVLGSGTNYMGNISNNAVLNFASGADNTLSGVISGSGSLVNSGTGILTLVGTNNYTGVTTISAGTLLVNNNSGACTNTVTVSSNAVFGGTGVIGGNVVVNGGGGLAPGGLGNLGMLTLTNNLTLNGSTLSFEFNTNSPATNGLVAVSQVLYLTNANSVILSVSDGLPLGNYTLMTYAATNGPGTFTLSVNYPNNTLVVNSTTLVVNATNLVLHVAAGDTWKGYVSGTWDTSALNWTNGNPIAAYTNCDAVNFDDTLVRNPTITNATPGARVSPGSVTFNNSLTNYTIGANIAGTGSLTLFGTAMVTLTGANTYTGNTTINAGNLVVTNGGAINSPLATLNILNGTNTLAGGAITVATLLATNNNYTATNSTFSFNGGTLVTSNNNGLAASILVASNTVYNINGNWTMNAGTNLITTALGVSNSNPALVNNYVKIGTTAANSGLVIMVNSNAMWSLGPQPSYAYDAATNNFGLYLGAGTASTNNQLVVNGGVVTNVFVFNMGVGANCVGNQFIITNGGAFYCGYSVSNNGSGIGFTLGAAGGANSNSVVVMGKNSSGAKATLDLGATRLSIGANSSSYYNSVLVGSGGVISNATVYMYSGHNSALIVTNGGVFDDVHAQAMIGRGNATNDIVIVAGQDSGGNPSTFNAGKQNFSISAYTAGSPSSNGTNNGLWVALGGLLTNATTIYIGGSAANETNDNGNYMIVTNGGSCYSTSGQIGSGTNDNGNWAYVGGAFGSSNALWNVGGGTLTVGAAYNANNALTVGAGGVVTNLGTLTVGASSLATNSGVTVNGGSLYAMTVNVTTNNSVLVNNGGVLTFSNLNLSAPGSPAVFTINNGTLVALGSGNWITNTGSMILNAGGMINNTAGYNVTNGVVMTGAGGLTVMGSGTLALTNVNTYSGNTFINGGTLALSGSGSLANSPLISVSNGAVFNVAGLAATFTLPSGQTLSNSAATTGTLNGSLTAVASSIVSVSYASGTPAFTITNGTLMLSGTTTFHVNNIGPALAAGSYCLITNLTGGSVAGTVPSVTVGGGSTAGTNSLAISNSALYLLVASPVHTNAYLTGITLTPALSFTPAFATNTLSGYTVKEAYSTNFTVTVTNADVTASNYLTYHSTGVGPLTNALASGLLSLNVNPAVTNVVQVQVTAQDGVTTKTYVVNVVELPNQLVKPVMTNSFNDGRLTLNWALANLGYRLLVQTINLTNGISTNALDWGPVPNSAATNTATITTTNANDYYRLVYP